MRFDVLVDDVVVGWTELESGDPPMGVVAGRLHPNDVRAAVRVGASFRVRAPGGDFLEPCAGVHVADHSAELGPEAIEISVIGLDEAVYRKYFAAHVQAYDARFAPTDPAHEAAAGRIALWLDPGDLEWLSRHCACDDGASEATRERCARIRFRASAALHKAGHRR